MSFKPATTTHIKFKFFSNILKDQRVRRFIMVANNSTHWNKIFLSTVKMQRCNFIFFWPDGQHGFKQELSLSVEVTLEVVALGVGLHISDEVLERGHAHRPQVDRHHGADARKEPLHLEASGTEIIPWLSWVRAPNTQLPFLSLPRPRGGKPGIFSYFSLFSL